MSLLAASIASFIMANCGDPTQKTLVSRSERRAECEGPFFQVRLKAPIPNLRSVMMDWVGNSYGVAHTTAASQKLQARILWG